MSRTKTLIIGDIHGCYEELQALLDQAALGPDDTVIALGDMVDRGPDSPGVYHWFRADPCRLALLGNHERKHVRWHAGRVRPALSQQITRHQLGNRWEEAVGWMARLPLFLDLPEALLVHGLYQPDVPLEEQQERVLTGTMSGEAYLTDQGYPRPWYELYQGAKPLVVGHQNLTGTAEPYVRSDQLVYGLDTGCVTGGRLTGLLLPDFRIVSVPSRSDHWSRVKARYGPLVAAPPPDVKLTFEELDHRLQLGAAAPGAAERAEQWRRLRAEAEAATTLIMEHVQAEHDRILAALEATPDDGLSLARRFDALITDRQLRPLLQQQRKGELDAARLRRYLRTPSAAVALAQRLAVTAAGQ